MPPTTDRIRAIHAAVILFLAALLMFWAEPLAARMVLPFLGGSPMVWTTAMVFFQVALLAGYFAAHLTAGSHAPGGAGRQNERPGAENAAGSMILGACAPGGTGLGWRAILPALARSEAALGPIAFDHRWTPLAANGGVPASIS